MRHSARRHAPAAPRVRGRAPPSARTLRPDDLYSLKTVGDPAAQPGRPVGRVHGGHARREEGRREHGHLHGPVRGRSGRAPHLGREGRDAPALQSRRALPGLPGQARRQAHAGVPDRPARRRGREAHGLSGARVGPGLVARRHAPGAHRVRRRPGRSRSVRQGEGRGRAAQADRDPRRQFKRDGEGYLRDVRSHLYVFDVARKTSQQLTSGSFDDSAPAWSPDGRHVAFVSNRTADPDSNQNTDVFVVPSSGGSLRTLVDASGRGRRRRCSAPDGTQVAFLPGGDPKDLWYGTNHVAVVPFAGGPVRPLTASLDRNAYRPRFAPDGASVLFLLEDGGNSHLAQRARRGRSDRRGCWRGSATSRPSTWRRADEIAVLESQPQLPSEVSAVESGAARRLSARERRFPEQIKLAPVERFETKSADGTRHPGLPDPPARRGRRPEAARDPAHPRRAGLAVLDGLRAGVADAGRRRLRGRRREPARLVRATAATSAGPSGPTGATRTSTTSWRRSIT